jgi:hypothetical protein
MSKMQKEYQCGSRQIGNTCEKCKKEFKFGDTIISRRTGSRHSRTKYYHKDCWESLFL